MKPWFGHRRNKGETVVWVTSDDKSPHHPKLIKAGAEACWLWHSSICYSNAHALNGRIEKDLLSVIYPPLAAKADRLAARLCQVKLWHDCGDFFEIHDYADFQGGAMKAAVEDRRTYERDRKRQQRAKPPPGQRRVVPDIVPDIVPDCGAVVPAGHHRDLARARDPIRSDPIRSDQDLSGSGSADLLAPARVNGSGRTGPNGSGAAAAAAAASAEPSNVTAENVSAEWNRLSQAKLQVHPYEHWSRAYETIAAACNAERTREGADPFVVMRAVVGYFWTAPAGPVVAGRLKHPDPGKLAKYISRDLEAAGAWYAQQKISRETAGASAP